MTQHTLDFFPDQVEVLALNPQGRPRAEIMTRRVLGGFVSAFGVTLSSAGTNSLWVQSATRAAAIQRGCASITEFIGRQRSPETPNREVAQVLDWVAGVLSQTKE